MVKSSCKKEDFQPITEIGEKAYLIKFSKETIMDAVYEGEGEERHPTGEYVDSGLVRYTEEMVYGELTPNIVRKVRLEELAKYDASPSVNEFFYGDKSMWFDKITRTTISYSMECEKNAGRETTDLYNNDGEKYTLPIDTALTLFAQVELYAKACYNQTQTHSNALKALKTVDELLAYDITVGYPEKLNFTL